MALTAEFSGAFLDRCAVATCRVCDAKGLVPVLDYGHMPASDGFLRSHQRQEPLAAAPLELVHCPACGLLQILHTLAPESLFGVDYIYLSSTSTSWLRHARGLAEDLRQRRGLGPDSLVVEIASNDGYLLRNFVEWGIPVLGIEPAPIPAQRAIAAGVATEQQFFNRQLAKALLAEHGAADVIVSNNVLAHVADLHSFVAGVAQLLAPGGIWVIEVPWLIGLIDNLAFDTVYHEHLCYFSLQSLQTLLARHGLKVIAAEQLSSHGGSLRVTVSHDSGQDQGQDESRDHGPQDEDATEALLAEERARGIGQGAYIANFRSGVSAVLEELRTELQSRRTRGQRIAGYGAAAKGTILLNALGVEASCLDYVVDRNPEKHGRWIPGVDLPIKPLEELSAVPPDCLLLLPWNLEAEIREQLGDYLANGGEILVPLPRPKVIHAH